MKLVRIALTWYESSGWGNSVPKFVGGQLYPLTDETQRQIDMRNGELVDAPDDADKAEAVAIKAETKADDAQAAADAARAAADAAAAAQAIATADPVAP